MPSNEDFMPRPDTEFHDFQDDFITLVEPHVTDGSWNITEADFTDLLPLQTDWENAWDIAKNKHNRTEGDVETKDEAREEYEKALRDFINEWIRFNKLITVKQRTEIGVPVPKEDRTDIPVPSTNPVLEINTKDEGRHYVRFKNEAPDTSRAKPFGVRRIEIQYFIGEEPPSNKKDYPLVKSASRNPALILFSGDDRGKLVHYVARWVNTTEEAGPWSPVYPATIT